jgi:adenylate cyclase, class 2
MSRSSQETEIKLPVPDAARAKRMLYRAGFRIYKRRTFEDNLVLDTAQGDLGKNACLLRLRDAGRKAIVTYKGRPTPSRHKSREELEVEVSSARGALAIFDRLGFAQVFRYQKYRTEYKQPGHSGVATVDETPIGVFVELEGNSTWIDRTAARLGFSDRDYITMSYGRLYLDWCERHRRRPGQMVFPSS